MSGVKKSGILASWIDDFVTGLAGKQVTANTNIKDLPKISWNDRVFYIQFKQQSSGDTDAIIYNDFPNYVTTVENASTLEEVEEALNGGNVIATDDVEIINENDEVSEDDFNNIEEELRKITSNISDSGEKKESLEDLQDDESVIEIEKFSQKTNEKEVGEKHASENNQQKENHTLEQNNLQDQKIKELESKIKNMNQKINDLEQIYARIDKFNDDNMYDVEEEGRDIQKSWENTRKNIDQEHTFDLTTPSGRYNYYKNKNNNQTNAEDSISVTKFSGKEEEVFKSGFCPFTKQQLVKTQVVGDYLGIYAKNGGPEYAVNLNTGEIYKHN
jgi:hypothetical protein